MKEHISIEFGISTFAASGANATVEGRCHRGPIRPGDIFTAISEMTVEQTPSTYGPTTLHPLATVHLKVLSVWAYGRQIDEISPAMTGRLELGGTGAGQLKKQLVLSD